MLWLDFLPMIQILTIYNGEFLNLILNKRLKYYSINQFLILCYEIVIFENFTKDYDILIGYLFKVYKKLY